jgi:hypothetical protein
MSQLELLVRVFLLQAHIAAASGDLDVAPRHHYAHAALLCSAGQVDDLGHQRTLAQARRRSCTAAARVHLQAECIQR